MINKKFQTENTVVFAAMSKRNFYLREHIIKFILNEGHTPTSAFMMYSYYLLDTAERCNLIKANNDLIRRSDELWVFENISDGVQKEIDLALELEMPIKYFKLENTGVKLVFHEIQKIEAIIEIPS
jgi:hypothetical protein